MRKNKTKKHTLTQGLIRITKGMAVSLPNHEIIFSDNALKKARRQKLQRLRYDLHFTTQAIITSTGVQYANAV